MWQVDYAYIDGRANGVPGGWSARGLKYQSGVGDKGGST